jgi:hypothetical protein
VVCAATDAAGNTARAAFEVTVVLADGTDDDTRPEITVPAPIRQTATSASGATVRYVVSATDNRDGSLRPRCAPPSGGVFAIGPTTVTCSATDRAKNEATESFSVTVIDGPPVLHIPSRIDLEATSRKGAQVVYDARATDAVDGALPSGCRPRSGSFFAIGTKVVTCSVTDSNGGTDTGSFTVVVTRNTTPPVIDGPTGATGSTSGDGTPVEFDVTARDEQDGRVRVTCSPPSGSVFPVGTTTVTCNARDRDGNRAEPLNFDVVVTQDPVE